MTWKKWIALAALTLFIVPAIPVQAEEEPLINGTSAVLLDMKTGQVLYQKNPHEHLYPASITKIMTATLALERSKLTDSVTASELAREQEGNRVYLETGEVQSMENMLYGMLLNSGNDAAIAIAEHVGGSVEGFAKLMNDKAKEIGANDSHFVNPNGLHDDQHYTSAYDMAMIGRYAMKNSTFREMVKTETRPWNGKTWQSVLYNINPMLYNYEGCTGIKTGFTDQAEQTMVTSAKRGDQELIAVVMHEPNKQTIREDMTRLLDYGFDTYSTKDIAKKDQVVGQLNMGENLTADVKLTSDFSYVLKKAKPGTIEPQLVLKPPTKLPIPVGTTVGNMQYTLDGKVVGTIPVVTTTEIKKPIVAKLFNWKFVWMPASFLFVGWVVLRRRKIKTISSQREVRSFRSQDYM